MGRGFKKGVNMKEFELSKKFKFESVEERRRANYILSFFNTIALSHRQEQAVYVCSSKRHCNYITREIAFPLAKELDLKIVSDNKIEFPNGSTLEFISQYQTVTGFNQKYLKWDYIT